VWDFRECEPDDLSEWTVEGAQATCETGGKGGLRLGANGLNTHLVAPSVHLQTEASGNRFLRLRVSVRYSGSSSPNLPSTARWLWRNGDEPWTEEHSQSYGTRQNGQEQVYWTFLTSEQTGPLVTGLRFDPTDIERDLVIQWIAVDLVK
jgi:hypothetical protein